MSKLKLSKNWPFYWAGCTAKEDITELQILTQPRLNEGIFSLGSAEGRLTIFEWGLERSFTKTNLLKRQQRNCLF